MRPDIIAPEGGDEKQRCPDQEWAGAAEEDVMRAGTPGVCDEQHDDRAAQT